MITPISSNINASVNALNVERIRKPRRINSNDAVSFTGAPKALSKAPNVLDNIKNIIQKFTTK